MNVFDPRNRIGTVTIVGLGGTGSVLARTVARIVYDMKGARMHVPKVRFIDHDLVEARNVGRQMFTVADTGQNKAAVLARRFNLALGLDIEWIGEPVNAGRHFERYGGNLVCGAVDNHEARRELVQVNGVLLDCGNHYNAGQVTVGNTSDREQVLRHIDGDGGRYAYLPNVGLLFPSLLEPELAPETPPETSAELVSCAELVAAGTQHLLVNDLVACVAGQYVYKLLRRMPVHAFLSFVSVETMTVRSLPICREELLPYLETPC